MTSLKGTEEEASRHVGVPLFQGQIKPLTVHAHHFPIKRRDTHMLQERRIP